MIRKAIRKLLALFGVKHCKDEPDLVDVAEGMVPPNEEDEMSVCRYCAEFIDECSCEEEYHMLVRDSESHRPCVFATYLVPHDKDMLESLLDKLDLAYETSDGTDSLETFRKYVYRLPGGPGPQDDDDEEPIQGADLDFLAEDDAYGLPDTVRTPGG
jgi:hypothetical protein